MASTARKINKKEKIDVTPYVNTETGEPLTSELQGRSMQSSTSTNEVMVYSDDYVIIDADAISFLRQHLNRSELGSIGIMSADLKTPLNIIYNNNVPHTNETLQKLLGIASNSTFSLLVRKLMKLGVLYQIKGNIMGKIRVIYMMNPFLARKRKILDEKVTKLFINFKNDINE